MQTMTKLKMNIVSETDFHWRIVFSVHFEIVAAEVELNWQTNTTRSKKSIRLSRPNFGVPANHCRRIKSNEK